MDRIEIPDRVVDFRREEVRGRDGARIELRPRAFGVLRRLAAADGALVSKDELLTECWPGVIVTEDSLTQCISEIRKALGEGGRELIRTVPRRGYALVPPPDAPQPPLSAAPKARERALNNPETEAATPNGGNGHRAARAETKARVAERRQLTLLSCELARPSALLSSRLDPEELGELLAAFHHRAAEVIGRWAGYVAWEAGESLMACFGYPHAHEDNEERAVQAAFELIKAAGKFALRDGPVLRVRIGIATGLVVVGGAGKLGHGMVGEAPSHATRLQAMAEPGTLVIDAGTQRRLIGLFDCRELASIERRDSLASAQAWQVLRHTAANSRSAALHDAAAADLNRPRLVGRSEELGSLQRRWQQAREGEGQVALISGEPGIGKSRLTAGLVECLAGEAYVTLRYFCSPHHEDSPLFPVIGQIERAAGFNREDTPAARLGKLTALLARATQQEDDIALIADLMSLPVRGRHPLSDLSPTRRRERRLQALLAQLVGLAAQHPVLMLFEDAHWIDPTSLELLSLTVERIRHHLPVLLVVTFRPDFLPPWIGLPHVTSLVLGSLGRQDATTLAVQTAGSAALPTTMVEQIVERTGGVPLFVEELTRAVVEADWHDASAAASDVTTLPACAVPAALYAPLAARLDRLGDPTREVAQIGAAIGRKFLYELLAAVAHRPEAELRSSLDHLVEAGLVFRMGGDLPRAAYLFKHALVRDVAYGTLLRTRRRELHRAIARAIVELFPETAAAQPALLAQHYAQAGQIEKSVECWNEAGRQAIAASAMAEARKRLANGLALAAEIKDQSIRALRQAELQLALGNVQIAVHGFGSPEHGAAFVEAVRLSRSLGLEQGSDATRLLIQALWGSFTYKAHMGEVAAAYSDAKELLDLGRNHPDPEVRAMSSASYGSSCLFLGRLRESAEAFAAVAADHEVTQKVEPMLGFGVDAVCQFHTLFSRLLACQGFTEQASEHARTGLERARRLRHLPTMGTSLAVSCDTAWALGDLCLLRQCSSELVRLAREQGFKGWLARGKCYAGWIATVDGEHEEGRALLADGIAEMASIGLVLYDPHNRAMLADTHARAGQFDDALAILDEALGLCGRTGEAWTLAELHRQKGELLSHRNPAAAETCFHQAISIARDQSAKLFELRASVSLARLWRKHGRCTEAHGLLAPVYIWFNEGFDALDLKDASEVLKTLG